MNKSEYIDLGSNNFNKTILADDTSKLKYINKIKMTIKE